MSRHVPAPVTPSGELEIICPSGDMIISCTTSGKNHRFKVSSQTLCTASSVFRAMLGPTSKFKEAQDLRNYGGADKLYEIPLEDDNLKVLRHILLCLHLQNLAVPNTISFEELVQAAVVTDKYDLGVALRLDWAYDNWLLVSWVFGEETIFNKVSEVLIHKAVIDEDSYLSFGTGIIVPDSVSRAISIQRDAAFDSVFQVCGRLLEQLAGESETELPLHCKYGGETDAQEVCDTFQYTLLRRRFTKAGLLPEGIETARLDDLEHLWRIFAGMTGTRGYLEGHYNCDVTAGLKEEVYKLIVGVKGLELAEFPSRAGRLVPKRGFP
ncbi:hypothetical protein BZA05DRAFT_451050 [Tricharina praecox]|uniref:uncharacterized protein n=1 Tax=Tricharina praecox TaxID=43433 RepID=UPI002220023B|nr:uncharacterized protein BZA05DRAFT_451050 [Tricharina praecox]KAI5859013.1 hypothetical protein BZA05DRAFT_451050 [Tricharina praecox]